MFYLLTQSYLPVSLVGIGPRKIDCILHVIWSVWGISMVHWSGLSTAFQWSIDLVCLGHFNGPLIWSVWGISMVHWSGLSGAFQWSIDLVCLGHFNGPLIWSVWGISMADSLICRRHISSRSYFTGIVGNNKDRRSDNITKMPSIHAIHFIVLICSPEDRPVACGGCCKIFTLRGCLKTFFFHYEIASFLISLKSFPAMLPQSLWVPDSQKNIVYRNKAFQIGIDFEFVLL